MKCHVLVVVVSLTSRLPFKVLEIHHCDVFALPLNWWRWWSAQVIVVVDGQLFIGKISISRRTFLVAVVSTVECGGRKRVNSIGSLRWWQQTANGPRDKTRHGGGACGKNSWQVVKSRVSELKDLSMLRVGLSSDDDHLRWDGNNGDDLQWS